MSTIINTTVPIPIDQLRAIIGDPEVKVRVDLSKASVKPLQALIYLSNLELDVDVEFDEADRLDVLDAYLNLPTLLKVPALETMVLEMMLHLKGIATVDYMDTAWADERRDVITKWASLIDSLIVYVPQIVEDEAMNKAVAAFPVDESNDMIGVNFVNLFDNPLFPLVMGRIQWPLVKNYTRYFNDYMYKGHNLFSYWARAENPLHVMSMALLDNDIATDEEFESFAKTVESLREQEVV